ncbi:MAG: phage/plasmid primase, P4 family [Chloroflexi bacterium]|nr:phage/plasmid primase, P4 family [Chloroflexota bacterium]
MPGKGFVEGRAAFEDLVRNCGGTPKGDATKVRCPNHEDGSPSLSVSIKADGAVLWKCFSGCDQRELTEEIRRRWPSLFGGDTARTRPPAPVVRNAPVPVDHVSLRHVCYYTYTDAEGNPRHRVERREAIGADGRKRKEFPQSHWTGSSWAPGVPEAKVPFLCLYYLQDIARTAQDGNAVWYCEGEKDADRLHQEGLVATTNAKSSLARLDVTPLTGRTVIIFVDNDDAGRKIAEEVATRVAPVAASVRVLELQGLPEHGDVSDWLDAGNGTVQDLLLLGSAAPIWEPKRTGTTGSPLAVPPTTPAREKHPDPESRGQQLTDADAAALFVERAGQDFRWVTDSQRWIEWDGRRWIEVPAEKVRHRATSVLDHELQDIGIPETKGLKDRKKWLGLSRSRARLDSMVALVKGFPAIAVKDAALDRDRNDLCVGTGVIALQTGAVHPHDRSDLSTRMVMHDGRPAQYIPLSGKVPPDHWTKFLFRVQPDAEVRDFLQMVIGAALTGTGAERRLFVMHGPGGAGKGTFMAVVMAALGGEESGYVTTGDADVLMVSRNPGDGSGHLAGIARWRGKRLVLLDETADGRKLDAGKVKRLVPGDGGEVVGRDLWEKGRDTRAFPASWLPVITTNHLPVAPADDDAMWDRFVVIPWDVRIAPEERTDVSASLKRDPDVLEHVLAWVVEGAVRWHRARAEPGGAVSQSGITLPGRAQGATHAWRLRSESAESAGDALAEWVRSDGVSKGDFQEKLEDLHASHTKWAQSVRAPVLSERAFAGALRASGVKKVKLRDGNRWDGIGLLNRKTDGDN